MRYNPSIAMTPVPNRPGEFDIYIGYNAWDEVGHVSHTELFEQRVTGVPEYEGNEEEMYHMVLEGLLNMYAATVAKRYEGRGNIIKFVAVQFGAILDQLLEK